MTSPGFCFPVFAVLPDDKPLNGIAARQKKMKPEQE